MKEMFFRSLYFFVIIILYFIGEVITKEIKDSTGVVIEFKFILPVFSLVYFDFYLKKVFHYFVRFYVQDKRIDYRRENVSVDMIFVYDGAKNAVFRINSIDTISSVDHVVTYEDYQREKKKDYHIPEDFSVVLGKDSPIFCLKIKGSFQKPLMPLLNIGEYKLYIYTLKLRYSLDLIKKVKKIYIVNIKKKHYE